MEGEIRGGGGGSSKVSCGGGGDGKAVQKPSRQAQARRLLCPDHKVCAAAELGVTQVALPAHSAHPSLCPQVSEAAFWGAGGSF